MAGRLRQPGRWCNVNDDPSGGCFVPVLQALFTLAIVALFVFFGALYLDVETRKAMLAGLAVGGAAAALVWFGGLVSWRRLAFPEPFYPAITRPERIEPVKVILQDDDGKHTEFIDLPATPDQLIRLATGLLEGATLSEAAWTGSGGIFTRAEFASLRSELIRRGLAAWNNAHAPAQGVTLTRGGQAAMRTFASMAKDAPTMRRPT